MQGGENIGNSSILEVPITQFSDSIQEKLRKPIPDFEYSNLETDDLWHALRNNGYTSKDDIYVIESDQYPIFREWDKDINSNCIFTRRIKNSNLAISPKPEVFLVIDYGLIEQQFNSIEHAQKVIEYWAEQTTNKIQKFEPEAPEIKVKIIGKKDFIENSPLSIYHENFSNDAATLISKPRTPKVIINCATLDNQLKFQPIQSHPLFNVNLLTVNSDDLSYKDEILKISEEIENGLIAVSRDSSDTECLRKILEITCTITTKYAFSSKEYLLSNLPEYFYNSLKNLANSKTASVGAKLHVLDSIYKEKSSSNYLACKPLVEKWKNTGMVFYQCLEDFDKVMENLNYNCKSDIRKCFEVMRNSIEVFENQIFNLGDLRRRPGNKIRDELKENTREKIEGWSKLSPQDKYREYNRAFEEHIKEKINDVYVGYMKKKEGFESKRGKINQLFYDLLLKNTPVRFPNDGKLLENILISYTAFKKITVESYSSYTICNSFHHAGVEDRAPWDKDLNDEEIKLYHLNINFNLVSHLELYLPLKDFLDFYIEQAEKISTSFHRLVLDYYKQFVGLELEDNLQEEE